MIPNSYPSDGIFNLHRRTIMDSFSCILFLRQLHKIRLEYVLFYQFYAKITIYFSIKKNSVRFLSYTLTSKRLAETDVKMKLRCQKRRQNVKIVILTTCTSRIHHSCKTKFPSPGQVHGNPGRLCKKALLCFRHLPT